MFQLNLKNAMMCLALLGIALCLLSPDAHAAVGAMQVAQLDEEASYEPTPIVKVAPKKKVQGFKKLTKKQSRDFYEAHKNDKKKSRAKIAPVASNPNAAVQSEDLMQAMLQNLNPKAAVVVAPAVAVVPTPAPAVEGKAEMVMPPLPAGALTQSAKPSDYQAGEYQGGVVLHEEKTQAPAPEPIIKEVKKETAAPVVKLEPKKEEAKPVVKGAPLLTDIPDEQDANAPSPKMEIAKEPEAPKQEKTETVQPVQQKVEVPEGYSKPRSLFAPKGDTRKRPGIEKVVSSIAAPMISVEEPKAETQVLPPVVEAPKAQDKEPMIKPVAEDKGIWKTAKPDMDKGAVIYSQSADGSEIQPVKEQPKEEIQSTQEADVTPPKKTEQANVITETPVIETPRAVSGKYNPSAGAMLHGSCGAVNGIGVASKPTTNLCTQGTPSVVSGNGPWSWSCQGSNGGTNANCSAPLQVNGECGMANGSLSASPPPGKLCLTGKETEITGAGPWYWSCYGDNGGVTAQCVAYTLVSGVCGASHNVPAANAPVSGLCASGQETAILGDGPWNWSCTGSGEGTTVNCSAPMLQSGVCGSANNVGAVSAPQTGLCESGTASAISGNGPWSWNCMGANGGASASCAAQMLLNAACGASHGVGTMAAPNDGLCTSGMAGAVTGDGPWNWNCMGENGGAMVNCMAPKKMNGLCGIAHQNGSADAPHDGLCTSGAPSAVSGSGPWQWSCQGAGGGITSNCISQPLVHAACGAAHGISVLSPPTQNLCASGNPTTIIGAGPFMWSCQGAHGGSAVNCMAPLQVNGACGAADGVPSSSSPVANLCRTGQASTLSGTGPWIWTCQGGGGGISSTCQAPLMNTPAPAAEVAPASSPVVHVPESTAKAGNECTPTVKRWTITCQQGGYPSTFTGVIVGETQVLCPMNVERGVWLSNSCAAATNSSPVSPSPGKLETPPPPTLPKVTSKVTDVLPDIGPMSAKDLDAPRKLFTPNYKGSSVAPPMAETAAAAVNENSTVAFQPNSEGLDTTATNTLDGTVDAMRGDDKAIVTLSAYAAVPADGNQQESRRLALARALSVRSYLMRKGLPSNRIDVRAVGPASDNRGDDRVDIKVK